MTTIFSISHILSGRDGDSLLEGFRKKTCSKGTLICGSENNESGIFIVFAGKLRVYLIGEDREMTLFYLVPGDIFCMHSGCIVEAIEKSEIRTADVQTFKKKMEGSPSLGWQLFAVLGKAMLSHVRTIESMAFYDVRQRISLFFLQQAGAAGFIVGDDLHASLTIDDIAHLMGSARQTTSTALNTLIKEGLVKRTSRGKYTILDHERLKALANGGQGLVNSGEACRQPGRRA